VKILLVDGEPSLAIGNCADVAVLKDLTGRSRVSIEQPKAGTLRIRSISDSGRDSSLGAPPAWDHLMQPPSIFALAPDGVYAQAGSPGLWLRKFGAKPARIASNLALSVSVRSSCAQAKNYCQCAIDLTKFAKRKQPVGFAEPGRVDGAELLDQDARPLAVDFHLRPERRRMSAC
jgi:hypothetical protein